MFLLPSCPCRLALKMLNAFHAPMSYQFAQTLSGRLHSVHRSKQGCAHAVAAMRPLPLMRVWGEHSADDLCPYRTCQHQQQRHLLFTVQQGQQRQCGMAAEPGFCCWAAPLPSGCVQSECPYEQQQQRQHIVTGCGTQVQEGDQALLLAFELPLFSKVAALEICRCSHSQQPW